MLDQTRKIIALDSWRVNKDHIANSSCIVKDWELVNVTDDSGTLRFLYGTVVSDYRMRFNPGGYVFTSAILTFDEEEGLVKTSNSLYCLSGDGEEVHATLLEAYKMKSIGQSLHLVRALERDVGTIMDPYKGPK